MAYGDSKDWAVIAATDCGHVCGEIAAALAVGESDTNAAYRARLKNALGLVRRAEEFIIKADQAATK